ncbi:MAG: hypothetical protein ACI91F_000348 [Candidatus Binatia bacterium]|jgi:hypothetical protein
MKRFHTAATSMAVLTALAFALVAPGNAHAQAFSQIEAKCTGIMAKSAAKLVQNAAKDGVKCLLSNPAASCPDAKASLKITKARAKAVKLAGKKCVSTCSVSGLLCIDSQACPPNGSSPEICTAGAKAKPMNASKIGFPGSLCGEITDAADIGNCVSDAAEQIAESILANVAGSIDSESGLTKEAEKCMFALGLTVGKTAASIGKTVAKCRDKVNRTALVPGEPVTVTTTNCQVADQKTSEKVAKAIQKLVDAIPKKCTVETLTVLDLCGLGVGGVTTVEAAQACLSDVAMEAGSTTEGPGETEFLPTSIINAAYPLSVKSFCGDNRVNPVRNQFALIGEECDGTEDSACVGNCLPPGDAFECTCGDIPRARRFVDGFAAKLDSGWTGLAHNAGVPDRAGFITAVTNCDCTEFDAIDTATCIGVSTDPICTVFAQTEPRCDWGLDLGDPSCDAFGDVDGKHEDADCAQCDAFTTNAGASCTGESDCNAQCYDTGGSPTGPCVRQSDCAESEVCRGRCNSAAMCVVLTNGAPLPLSSSGTQTCVRNEYFSDVEGTANHVTGEHIINYELRAKVFLGTTQTSPCPTCGGYCLGGDRNEERCEGTCGDTLECRFGSNDGTICTANGDCTDGGECWGLDCRFDSDCPGPEEVCSTATPSCAGGPCQLDLICAQGIDAGDTCRVEAFTNFGTTSVDCQPLVGKNISGAGLQILFQPTTSELVALPFPGACDAQGFENFDCNCVLGTGSIRTKPNKCNASCNAGAELGQGCVTGNTGSGIFTTCSNSTAACDEDSDCPGGTCTDTPVHCTAGDPEKSLNSCSVNADCDTLVTPGDGVCGDACPSGRCVPLCLPSGQCNGGSQDGLVCGDTFDCAGFPCDVVDPDAGVCGAGKTFHCSGEFESLPCQPEDENTTQNCDEIVPGAGICVADVALCYLPDHQVEGGDTLNGNADPTNFFTVANYCVPATTSVAVNSTAGLPGMGRLRQGGTSVLNVPSLP